jgi:hypothetical protein
MGIEFVDHYSRELHPFVLRAGEFLSRTVILAHCVHKKGVLADAFEIFACEA